MNEEKARKDAIALWRSRGRLDNVVIEALYGAYGPMVLRCSKKILRDEALAVEARNDIFVKVLEKRHVLKNLGLSSFFYKTTTNHCLNMIRNGKHSLEIPADDLVMKIATADIQPRWQALLSLQGIFKDHWDEIRVLGVYNLVDGLTNEEIGKQLGLSEGAVRYRLRKLRRSLKRMEAPSAPIPRQKDER